MKEKDDSKKEELKVTALKLPESVHKEFKSVAAREGLDMQEIYTDLVKDYLKKHGSGNPTHAITNWLEVPTFKAYPAFMRTREDWQEYIEKFSTTEQAKEIMNQALTIATMAQNKVEYGTTNVRKY